MLPANWMPLVNLTLAMAVMYFKLYPHEARRVSYHGTVG